MGRRLLGAQAERGAASTLRTCAKCHGANGTGGDAPDLVGAGFASDWDNQPVGALRSHAHLHARRCAAEPQPGADGGHHFVCLHAERVPVRARRVPEHRGCIGHDQLRVGKTCNTRNRRDTRGSTFDARYTRGARQWCGGAKRIEVATIKPSAGQADRANVGVRISGSQVRVADLTLKDYIGLAYGIRPGQVTGPDWIGQERFDISAKFPDDVKRGDFALMLQTLLADRFQLVVHREAKDLPVYELAVAKSGLKLREAVPDANAVPVRPGTTNVAASGSAAGVDMDLGGGASFSLANNKLEIRKMTMASMADSLMRLVDRPVLDKTGLTGIYDLTLEFTPEDYTGLMVRGGLNAGVVLPPQALRALDAASANPFAIPLENYGLTLESRRAPVDLIVVDSMQKTPKEN